MLDYKVGPSKKIKFQEKFYKRNFTAKNPYQNNLINPLYTILI